MANQFLYGRLTDEELKGIGGLSREDRNIPGVLAIADLAVPVVARFKEALRGGGMYGLKEWFETTKQAARRLREANSETALGFLLRKGVQTVANDWYQTSPAVWREYCAIVASNTLAEWYAPLYPSTIADRVQRGQRFPESRIVGEDSVVVNHKFGLIVSVERELFDDDQTGQISQRASILGTSMAVTESIWASSRFIGAARTYANVVVPASDYTTTDINGTTVSGPFSSTLYGSALGNRPQTAYRVLNMGNLKEAYQTTMNAVDPLQNKITVTPNTLLVSTTDFLNAQLLMAPGYYPASPGQSNQANAAHMTVLGGITGGNTPGTVTGALTGFPGGAFSPNPFGGLGIKVVCERYLPNGAWALGQSGKGFIFQERDPLEVVQEGMNTGSYFTFDSIAWRSRRRFNAEWVGGGSRFWYLGNDGASSINSQQ